MRIIQHAIDKPMSVIAAVLITVVLGVVLIKTIPIQLTPDVNRPILVILTYWGNTAPANSLAEITVTTGPSSIRHLDRARSVSVQIRPAKTLPLEEAIEIIRQDVIEKLEAEGLPAGIKLRLSGAADNLTKTWSALQWNLIVAGIIVYLLMAVLFQNLFYPLIIMLSVPLATAGGGSPG